MNVQAQRFAIPFSFRCLQVLQDPRLEVSSEAIADTVDGLDQLGVIRLAFELAAGPADVDIDVPGAIITSSPQIRSSSSIRVQTLPVRRIRASRSLNSFGGSRSSRWWKKARCSLR